ncbi:MAG: hypothetical protein FJX76_25790 [Armatimonadetes bacterium]|nr:hypothetical protein [Armatimonadota bacterium]
MIASTCTDPRNGLQRFNEAASRLQSLGGFAGNNSAITPADGYARGEMFLGSHSEPERDVIHLMSFRQETDGEHILHETFLRRSERGFGDWITRKPAHDVVYHLLQEHVRGTSGSGVVDAVLAAYDPRSGALISREVHGEAYDRVERLEAETGLRLT